MKARKLQLKRALSAALFVLLLSVAGSKNAFAQTLVATLQHGDNFSAYYGINALVEAHAAAADGDIITLSSGRFTPPSEITKAITLRGAGVVADTVAGFHPTILEDNVYLNVSNDSIALNIEGIQLEYCWFIALINPKFTKCSIDQFVSDNGNSNMVNAQFVNCIIRYFSSSRANNTAFINSVVWNPHNFDNSHTVVLCNSIFGQVQNNSVDVEGVLAYNSIIIRNNAYNGYYYYTATCSFFNCIGIETGSYSAFGSAAVMNCVIYNSYADVFESFNGNFSLEELEEPFMLKDEIITGFLGNDGTQVGIYGGMTPYNNRPDYMVLKRCTVANRTNSDNKLSVEVEVVTEEE